MHAANVRAKHVANIVSEKSSLLSLDDSIGRISHCTLQCSNYSKEVSQQGTRATAMTAMVWLSTTGRVTGNCPSNNCTAALISASTSCAKASMFPKRGCTSKLIPPTSHTNKSGGIGRGHVQLASPNCLK
eukprot:3964579-Amphidinium_carterae.1